MNHEFSQSIPENSSLTVAVDTIIERAKTEVEPFTVEQTEAMARLDKLAPKDNELMINMADITGVLANIKPSAFVMSSDVLRQFAETMGLVYQQVDRRDMAAISRSEDVASELVDSFEALWDGSRDRVENHRNIGKLLGYPETATEYFIERSSTVRLPVHEQLPFILPEELEGTVHMEFLKLVLSPDNWREELESYVTPIEASVQEFAPVTYEAFEKKARRARMSKKFGALAAKQDVSSPFNSADVALKRVR